LKREDTPENRESEFLSLARLPFRHARNRHQIAPRTAESQAWFLQRAIAQSRKVCLRSGHVILVQVW